MTALVPSDMACLGTSAKVTRKVTRNQAVIDERCPTEHRGSERSGTADCCLSALVWEDPWAGAGTSLCAGFWVLSHALSPALLSYPESYPNPLQTTPGEAARTTSGTAEARDSRSATLSLDGYQGMFFF